MSPLPVDITSQDRGPPYHRRASSYYLLSGNDNSNSHTKNSRLPVRRHLYDVMGSATQTGGSCSRWGAGRVGRQGNLSRVVGSEVQDGSGSRGGHERVSGEIMILEMRILGGVVAVMVRW